LTWLTRVAGGRLFGLLDKTAQTAFYVTEHGGARTSGELFWFFGHPRSNHGAPALACSEILRVHPKPLFAFRIAAAE